MGRLINGPGIDIEIDDNVLANLDLVINRLRGMHFSIQITGLGGAHDGNFGLAALWTRCAPRARVPQHRGHRHRRPAVSSAVQDARSVGVLELNALSRRARGA